jgi:hypothetical protein
MCCRTYVARNTHAHTRTHTHTLTKHTLQKVSLYDPQGLLSPHADLVDGGSGVLTTGTWQRVHMAHKSIAAGHQAMSMPSSQTMY